MRARGTTLIGLPQRFCGAKDLWEEGEQVLSWQRHSVAHLRTRKRRIVRAVSGFPRRCVADAWEEEQRAAADLRALWRRGDSFRLLRRHLPQRGRQGNRIYSLSHGVGFQPNAVTAPSRRRLQYAILQSKKAPAHPQGGAYNKELYTVRKRFLAPEEGGGKKHSSDALGGE